MGLRFRKSIKIAPGVKLNLNKKSTSITVGKKGAHYTVNSSGKKTASVGIPETGLSYSTSSGGGSSKTKKKTSSNATANNKNGNGSGCGGCLLAFFGVCLAVVVLGFIINYAWIPGIIAAIYFAKKTPDKKQRNIRVGISIAVTVMSFLAFLTSMSEPDLTELTVNWGRQEYDISEEVRLKLDVVEEGADIYSLTISDNDIARVEYKENDGVSVAIVTFINEGTADISFTANNEIQSNVTTITVVDKEAEEQRAKEEAERKAQEEAEAQKKAEEEAQKKAEEEAKAQAEQEAEEPQEEMVWIPSSGSKYHSNSGCSGMNNPTEVTISEAKSRGYTACKRCY